MVSKLSGFFQIFSHFPDGFKTIRKSWEANKCFLGLSRETVSRASSGKFLRVKSCYPEIFGFLCLCNQQGSTTTTNNEGQQQQQQQQEKISITYLVGEGMKKMQENKEIFFLVWDLLLGSCTFQCTRSWTSTKPARWCKRSTHFFQLFDNSRNMN